MKWIIDNIVNYPRTWMSVMVATFLVVWAIFFFGGFGHAFLVWLIGAFTSG